MDVVCGVDVISTGWKPMVLVVFRAWWRLRFLENQFEWVAEQKSVGLFSQD